MEREFDGTVTPDGGGTVFPARIRSGKDVFAGFTRETAEAFVEWVNLSAGDPWSHSAVWEGDVIVLTLTGDDDVVIEERRITADETGRFWVGGRTYMWDTPDGV